MRCLFSEFVFFCFNNYNVIVFYYFQLAVYGVSSFFVRIKNLYIWFDFTELIYVVFRYFTWTSWWLGKIAICHCSSLWDVVRIIFFLYSYFLSFRNKEKNNHYNKFICNCSFLSCSYHTQTDFSSIKNEFFNTLSMVILLHV